MKKSELKTGMIIENKAGRRRVILLGTDTGDTTCTNDITRCNGFDRLYDYYELSRWNEDLTAVPSNPYGNIVRVWGKYGGLIWEKKERLEVGKWYRHPVGGYWFIKSLLEKNEAMVYGFTADLKWFNLSERTITTISDLATHSEIEEALKDEAKKRYKVGDLIKYRNPLNSIPRKLAGTSFVYYGNDTLSASSDGKDILLQDGVWSEVESRIDWSRLPLVRYHNENVDFTVQMLKDGAVDTFEGVITSVANKTLGRYAVGYSSSTWLKEWDNISLISYIINKTTVK